MNILFVCMGNICRSPTAEGVFRAQAAARRRGYDLSGLRARRVAVSDFEHFDLILAMDARVLAALRRQAQARHRHKIQPYMDYARARAEREVPDPYYGGPDGFEHALDLIEDVSHGLLARYGGQASSVRRAGDMADAEPRHRGAVDPSEDRA